MIRLDTTEEVASFLVRYAAAEKHKPLAPLTEAEYAEIEAAYAAAPEIPGMTDADVDAIFGDDTDGDWGEDDTNPNAGT